MNEKEIKAIQPKLSTVFFAWSEAFEILAATYFSSKFFEEKYHMSPTENSTGERTNKMKKMAVPKSIFPSKNNKVTPAFKGVNALRRHQSYQARFQVKLR